MSEFYGGPNAKTPDGKHYTSTIEKITPKTKAIISVSLFGLSPEYDQILENPEKYKGMLKFGLYFQH